MKFSSTFSALLVLLPLVAHVGAAAIPEDRLARRDSLFPRTRGRQGRQGGGRQQGGQNQQQKAQQAQQQANAAKANQAQQQANAAKAQQAAQQAAAAKAAAAKGQQNNNGNAANNAAAGSAASGTAAAGNTGAAAASAGAPPNAQAAQTSNTLFPAVIQVFNDGQNPPVAGQSPADVSTNNFINFCATGLPQVPLTNGKQIETGSCNPTPIGNIPAKTNMPSGKFQSPANFDTIQANQAFTVSLKVNNIQLGDFTNAQATYFINPQKLNAQGNIIGHTHIVIEKIDSFKSTTVTDPTIFQFFKGIDQAQDGNGIVNQAVDPGLPPAVYRMCTIMSSATHQPAIVPVAQHGALDDCVYFETTANGQPSAGNPGAAAAGTAAAGNAAAAGTAAAGTAAAGTAAAGTAAAGTAAAGNAAAGQAAPKTAAGQGNAAQAAQAAQAAKAAQAAQAAKAKGAQKGGAGAKKGGAGAKKGGRFGKRDEEVDLD